MNTFLQKYPESYFKAIYNKYCETSCNATNENNFSKIKLSDYLKIKNNSLEENISVNYP